MVPLCFEKSKWTVVAQIAVLKAGGACVSIDYTTPKHRVKTILDSTQANVAITTPAQAQVFAGCIDRNVVLSQALLERLARDTSSPHLHEREVQVSPNNAAFVVFTSGSTGVPKGIVTEHRAICTSAKYHGEAMHFTPASRVLQFAAYTFDVSISDTFVTLVHGGCVCIPSEEDRKGNLAAFIAKSKVNSMCLTSTVISFLRPPEVPSVRYVTLGGEPLSKEDLLVWADSTHLGNVYGPAEAAVWCIHRDGLTPHTDPMNIGSPVGCRAWVVDVSDHQRLLPVGCVGELLLEGPILARGYLNDPARTAAAFIETPGWILKHRPISRLYKTGDLARMNVDGTISFAGRRDTQVKLQGQRVELGEIQYHVQKSLPEPGKVAVEVIKSKEGRDILVAFVSMKGCDPGGIVVLQRSPQKHLRNLPEELTSRLTEILPSYMVPAAFISLNPLPQTPSGKLDRKQLRQLGSALSTADLFPSHEIQGASRRPLTSLQVKLSLLWGSVLNIKPSEIGIASHFRKLGGDSLCAMRLVAAAHQEGLDLGYSQIMRHPTLDTMAAHTRTLDRAQASPLPPFSLLPERLDLEDTLEEASDLCEVPRSAIVDVYPCTPLQEGIIALSQRQPGTYIGRHILELPFTFDFGRFRLAWDALNAANDILRTRIVHGSSGFWQVILNAGASLEESEENSIKQYVAEDEARSMVPGSSLVRAAVVTIAEGRYFVLTIHHAACDGWSLAKLLEGLHRLYLNPATEIKSTPFKYFIAHLQSANIDTSHQFWRSQLGDFTSPTFPRMPSNSYKPRADHVVERDVPFSADSEVTLNVMVRAAWGVLISRYQSLEDVAFGTTLAGRNVNMRGIESISGPTMTTVPIRARIQGPTSTKALLDQFHVQSIEMLPFEHTGLQTISRTSSGGHSACDFQSLIVMHPGREVADEQHDFALRGDQDVIAKAYAMMIECTPRTDGLRLRASFDSNVVDNMQMKRILGQLDHVLQQLSRPSLSTTVDDIEVISPGDAAEIAQWNRERPPSCQTCVHSLIEQQAARTPEATAVCAWDGQLSYAQLNDLSSTLAYHLKVHGVGPEVFVPLCFEKSRWAIVAELAVLKAGGACVSVDPAHPPQRLEHIFQDVHAHLVVTTSMFAHMFEKQTREVVTVNDDLFRNLVRRPGYSCPAVKPSNAAFVVFTSGSTGTPKGICQDHAAYCTNVRLQGPIIGAGPGRRVLQFAAHTFDAFLSDIITTLSYGGCCCVPSEAERLDDLAGFMNRMRVNQALLTPSVVNLLTPVEVPTLKHMILSGEVLTQENLLVWADKVHLINLYGPAECTIWTTYTGPVRPDSDPRNIGKGVGALTWVTEPTNPYRLAPIGAVGELLIDGEGLARGYMNAKEKTEQSFIDSPSWLSRFHRSSRRKLYRTGDLVSYNSDGSIRIVGRRDTQVKLRGQRLELSEVEHHLRLHIPSSAAQFAVELVTPAQDDSDQLLATFVCPKTDPVTGLAVTPGLIETLRAELPHKLREDLPPYMIPTAFIPLKAMPLTVHSKVDRAQLRKFGSDMSKAGWAPYSTSQSTNRKERLTSAAIRLRNLWAGVLNIESSTISADDNFIALGGDSIRAMTLVARCRVSGISLSVAQVFKSPVLQDMAKSCWMGPTSPVPNGTSSSVDTCRHGRIQSFSLIGADKRKILSEITTQLGRESQMIEDVYPATPMQEALIVLTAKQPGSYTGRYVFQLPPGVEIQRLRTAWNEAFHRHAILRTRLLDVGRHGTFQVVLKGEIDWLCNATLESCTNRDDRSPFTFGQPLARFALVEGGTGEPSLFVLTIHHAVFDGWSLPALFDDVDHIYRGLWPVEPLDFKHFMQYCSAIDHGAMESYWRSQLQGTTQASYPVLPSKTYQTSSYSYLTHEVALSQERPNSAITTATIIYAAWALLMARYSASNDVVFGAILAGRNVAAPDIDRIAGPTITAVPVRVAIDGNEPVVDFSRRVQQQQITMIDFQHAGLQAISSLSPDARAACDFQTILSINSFRASKRNPTLGDLISDEGSANFHTYPILLECSPARGMVEVKITYDDAIVDCTQMKHIVRQFGHVMQQINKAPQDQRVREIDLTSMEEKCELRWMQETPGKVETCVHQLVEQQVLLRPQAIAVEAWNHCLTFSELDVRATRVACQLQRFGARPDMIIPVCFEKSMWAVVAMLAVSKSGAAFVALDPNQPLERLRTIVAIVNAQIVLGSQKTLELCQKFSGIVITVSEATTVGFPPSASLQPLAAPSNLFYVVFTSGSTGTPKGALIDHAAYASGLATHGASMHIGPGTRVFQYSSYAFDASILEIMSTLALGGCVCIPSDQERTDDVIGAMNRMQVQFALLTPSVADFLAPTDVPSLKTLVLGGEALKPAHVKTWSDKVQLVNAFGPSECSVVIVVNSKVSCTTDPANIGSPVGVICWVVEPEDHDHLAPFGTVGELLVEGPTLARGYYNEPVKTDAAFIWDPAWARDASLPSRRRFYKTGDLVRWNPDATLAFVGRKDTQVKIHGQRAELGEIERCLGSHQDIKHNVIMLPSSGQCAGKLTALVSLHSMSDLGVSVLGGLGVAGCSAQSSSAVTLGQLRSYLSTHLPSYMVPQIWYVIADMPLLSTGKIDRSLLKQWLISVGPETCSFSLNNVAEAPPRPPETAVEKDVCQVVVDILGKTSVPFIDLNSSFLTLGGDSITAMRVTRGLKSKGIVVTVLQLLRSQSIWQLCQEVMTTSPCQGTTSVQQGDDDSPSKGVCRTQLGRTAVNDLPLLCADQAGSESLVQKLADNKLAGTAGIYACSPMQQKMLRSQQTCPHFYQSYTLFEVVGPSEGQCMTMASVCSAWEVVVSCHQILRTVFVRDEATGEFSQVVLGDVTPNTLQIEGQPLDACQELHKVPKVGLRECMLPHRLAVCQDSSAIMACRLDINHSLLDGPSLHTILQDLTLALAGCTLSSGPDYSRYIAHLQSRDSGTHLSYWRDYLEDLIPCQFPTDSEPYGEYASMPVQILRINDLKAFCSHRAVTLSTLLRTTWGLVLRHFLRKHCLSFGYLVSARNLPIEALNQIIGPLLSVLPCRFNTTDDQSLASALTAMQQDSAASLAHEAVSLPEVCASAARDEDALFNTLINFRQFDPGDAARGAQVPELFRLEDRGGSDPMDVSRRPPAPPRSFLLVSPEPLHPPGIRGLMDPVRYRPRDRYPPHERTQRPPKLLASAHRGRDRAETGGGFPRRPRCRAGGVRGHDVGGDR